MNFYVRKLVDKEDVEKEVNDLLALSYNVTIEEQPECERELFYEILPDTGALKRKIKAISRKGFIHIEWEERDAVIEGKEFVLTAWRETGVKFLVVGYRKHGAVL